MLTITKKPVMFSTLVGRYSIVKVTLCPAPTMEYVAGRSFNVPKLSKTEPMNNGSLPVLCMTTCVVIFSPRYTSPKSPSNSTSMRAPRPVPRSTATLPLLLLALLTRVIVADAAPTSGGAKRSLIFASRSPPGATSNGFQLTMLKPPPLIIALVTRSVSSPRFVTIASNS